MSFREKTAWISLITMAAVYGRYFWVVARGGRGTVGDILTAVIVLVILQVGLIVTSAILSPRDASAPKDERDRLIDLKATRTAYVILIAGLGGAGVLAAFQPPHGILTNSLLFVVVMAEALRMGSQIVQYRRGSCNGNDPE